MKLVNRNFSFKPVFTFWLYGLNIRWKNETFSRKILPLLPDKLFKQGGLKLDFTLCEMSTCYFHHTPKRLSTNIFDIMKVKILFLPNSESPKYIAKLFSLSIYLPVYSDGCV